MTWSIGSSCSDRPFLTSPSSAVVIDVRTPEEFAAGHIERAELLDFRSADFAAGVQQLDPEERYVV